MQSQQSDQAGPAAAADNWWRDAVIYQIYPRSFADSDGDGIGDLPGITARLEHLTELGVDALWLSPFYPSPQADAGYDVADYRDVDPIFGDLADAYALIESRRTGAGLKVIVDLVPNHTSSAHPWFAAALAAAPGSPERARYIFRDGRGPGGDEPPNDWQSVFGGPAWSRVTEPDGSPGQWYLHLFDPAQPDLNWDNAEVRAEFLDILRFWLERGVDGFRVDVAHGLVKQADLADWHYPQETLSGGTDQRRPPMWDQEGVHEIYRSWRALLDTYPGGKILVAEAWVQPAERLAAYTRPDEMHQAFNFEYLPGLLDRRRPVRGDRPLAGRRRLGRRDHRPGCSPTTTWSGTPPGSACPVGTPRPNGIGIGDPQPDVALGLRRARAASLLMLALPGSAYLYQGEELGLPEHTAAARRGPAGPDLGAERPHRTRPRRLPGADPVGGRRPVVRLRADRRELAAAAGGSGPSTRSTGSATCPARRTRCTGRRCGSAATCGLGSGTVEWLESGDEVLFFRNGPVRVLTNFGAAPVPLPEGAELLHASGPLDTDGRVPTDVTVWLRD